MASLPDIKTVNSELRNEVAAVVNVLEKEHDVINQDIADAFALVKESGELNASYAAVLAESQIIPLVWDAYYHVYRIYFFLSPGGVIAVVAGMVTAAKILWSYIKWVVDAWRFLDSVGLVDLLYDNWEFFRQAVDDFREWSGRISEVIGWGFDGVGHAINAIRAGSTIYGCILGKSKTEMEARWLQRSVEVAHWIEDFGLRIQQGDLTVLDSMFIHEADKEKYNFFLWSEKLFGGLDSVTEKADTIALNVGTITHELSALRTGMPYFIAEYIPNSIWSGLERADSFINDKIMPALSEIERVIDRIETRIDAYKQRIAELEDQAKYPGDLLLNVDDLSEAHRVAQEAKIDDVVSRNLGRGVDADIDEITPNLMEFALLDEALTAPTPEPVFLTLESPERHKIEGIVYEPGETWFVGDY